MDTVAATDIEVEERKEAGLKKNWWIIRCGLTADRDRTKAGQWAQPQAPSDADVQEK